MASSKAPVTNNQKSSSALFSGAIKNWKFVAGFLAFSIVFWLLEFAYQFFAVDPNNLNFAIVRSFAFASGTFIALALLSSAVFKWKPGLAKHWPVRRSLGVVGTVFALCHVLSVLFLYVGGNVQMLYPSLNPLENPIVFGTVSLLALAIVSLVSTDWAIVKLGAKNWKNAQRLVYLGFWGLLFHFLLINPPILQNLAGYLLIVISFLALAGQLFWFVQTAAKQNFKSRGTLLGILLIFLFLLTAYLLWVAGKWGV